MITSLAVALVLSTIRESGGCQVVTKIGDLCPAMQTGCASWEGTGGGDGVFPSSCELTQAVTLTCSACAEAIPCPGEGPCLVHASAPVEVTGCGFLGSVALRSRPTPTDLVLRNVSVQGSLDISRWEAVTLDDVVVTNTNPREPALNVVAVRSVTGPRVSIHCNTFTQPEDNGGGLSITDSTLSLDELTVQACATQGSGGGVFVSNSTVRLGEAHLANCTASGNGGGVFAANSTFSAVSLSCENCAAGGAGGGLLAAASTCEIVRAGFHACTAGERGGAVALLGAQSTILELVTQACSAGMAAGVFLDKSKLKAMSWVASCDHASYGVGKELFCDLSDAEVNTLNISVDNAKQGWTVDAVVRCGETDTSRGVFGAAVVYANEDIPLPSLFSREVFVGCPQLMTTPQIKGVSRAEPAGCTLDECAGSCPSCANGACASENQTCSDPDTSPQALGDWTCSCPAPSVGAVVGKAAVCECDECGSSSVCARAHQTCFDPTRGCSEADANDFVCTCEPPQWGQATAAAAVCVARGDARDTAGTGGASYDTRWMAIAVCAALVAVAVAATGLVVYRRQSRKSQPHVKHRKYNTASSIQGPRSLEMQRCSSTASIAKADLPIPDALFP
ncbi:hypothetical protein DIPPA_22768 [Diplonema papillatum]|nr:hypothetical protein DIPPA_25537 [Diplonema papillatum]KAJ9456560.1 hypothetical protein DIPPA_22768 [Diplonema papillatum]